MKASLCLFACVWSLPALAETAPVISPQDSCCKAMEPAAFTTNSLYQAEVKFTDDNGKFFDPSYLRGRPVVLAMFFSSCGYACPLIVSDMQAIQAQLPESARQSTAFVLVSFDTLRDSPEALANYRKQRGLGERWTLLHGDNDSVRELAALLGVKYKRETDGAYSHSNLITVLNAEGEIVHQRDGLNGGVAAAATAVVAAQKRR